MKIYTRTGDKGETSLIGGTRVKKFDPRLEAYGTVDELNSFIGLLRSCLRDIDNTQQTEFFLNSVQHQLFKIGSLLACEDPEMATKLPQFDPKEVESAEEHIDQLQENLPELKNFILPGGGMAASFAHVCRTVCRRAERRMSLIKDEKLQDSGVFLYLNRLSDYFFVLARACNRNEGVLDVTWDQTQ